MYERVICLLTIEKLQKDMMAAMKAGDPLRKSALSTAVSEVKKAAIDKMCKDNITEDLIISVIRKEIKILDEQLETCTVGRPDARREFETKKAVLSEYVPQLITNKDIIKDMICQHTSGIEHIKSNKGLVMKSIMPHFRGKVDMKITQEVVDSILV